MLGRRLEMLVVGLRFQSRQQGAQRGLRVADQSKVDLRPPAELLAAQIDLHDRGFRRIELRVGKSVPIISSRSQFIIA